MIPKAKGSTSPTTTEQLPTTQLRHYAEINPPTAEFSLISPGDPVTFMSLDTVWPDGHADVGAEIVWTGQSHSYTPFRRGDVLLPKVSPTFSMGRATVADTPHPVGLASSEVYVLRPRENADARFIAYAVRSTDFLAEGTASQQGVGGLRRVSSSWVGSYKFPQFDLPAQRRIADYLDRETAQIDAMAGALDGLVARLEERRASLARQHVESAIGRHPFTQVKFVANISTGTGDTQDATETGYPFYVRSNTPVFSDEWEFEGDAVLTAGDGAGVGRVYHLATGKFRAHQRVYVINNFRTIIPKYFLHVFRALFPGSVFSGNAQTTVPSVRLHMISDLRIPLPPLDEQRRIAAHLDAETAKIDAMIAKAGELRALLDERRSALITATVTGQHPVPEEP